MKPTVTRGMGGRITRIRFQITTEKPWHRYMEILEELPQDEETRVWKAGGKSMQIIGGFAEVRRA